MTEHLLKVESLTKYYPVQRGLFSPPLELKAIDGVDFTVEYGETLSLVGESGCGKSTLARQILKIEEPTDGEIFFREDPLSTLRGSRLRKYWQSVQLIFQNPYSCLNPMWKVGQIIAEPLKLNTNLCLLEIKERVEYLLEKVGLDPQQGDRYPHQFSGGQRQRIGIARALALGPKLLICDEPVSALDVSIQSQVLNLLMDLQKEDKDLSYLFISHDLSVVEHLSDRVMVMYLGKIVERGSCEDIFESPHHPYTKALLSAIPTLGKKKVPLLLQGDIPSPLNPPAGCTFRSRCPFARSECETVSMSLEEIEPNHWSACPFVGE